MVSSTTPEKRERRGLWVTFALLFFAVLLPLGGMVWFMTAAVQNEQMAVRQRLTEVYKAQLATTAERLDEVVDQQRAALINYTNLPPRQRFDALVRERVSDSILILGENLRIRYPAELTTTNSSSAIGIEIQQQIRQSKTTNALQYAKAALNNPDLQKARDESGRLILPALQLFCLQQNEEASSTLLATNYTLPIQPARRLFYLQELAQLGFDTEPWLTAETLAARFSDTVLPAPTTGYIAIPESDAFLLYSKDLSSAAIFRRATLFSALQKTIGKRVNIEGMQIILSDKSEGAWLSHALECFSGSQFLCLSLDGNDPFSSNARRRVFFYLWIGLAVIGLMGIVCGLLVRSLLAQQRLTRLKNDFVATVTHELKTPLASTRMFVDTLLEGRVRDEQQQREYLELIARENQRLSRLIDNFLTFSRMERNRCTFNFAEQSPAQLIKLATESVRDSVDAEGCELTADIAENLPAIWADADAIVTVLLNLLGNACKYSDEDKRIKLSVFKCDGDVCFRVEDHGIGMTRRELAKIFDRFYQIDQSLTRKVGGAGLGLSIVHFIVTTHGGKIDVESQPGEGSIFTVRIPTKEQ